MKKRTLALSILIIVLATIILSGIGSMGNLSSSILDDGRPEEYVQADIRSLQTEIAEKQMTLSGLENALATNPDAAESLQAEIDSLRGAIASLESQINDLNTILSNRVAAYLAQQEYLAQEERKFQERIAPIQADIAKYTAEKAGLESTIAAQNLRIKKIEEEEIPAFNKDIEQATADKDALDKDIKSAQEEIGKIDKLMAPFNDKKKPFDTRIEANTITKGEVDRDIKILKGKTIPGLTQDIATLGQEILDLDKKIKAYAAYIVAVDKRIQNEGIITKKNDEISKLDPKARNFATLKKAAENAITIAQKAIMSANATLNPYIEEMFGTSSTPTSAEIRAKLLLDKTGAEDKKKTKNIEKTNKNTELNGPKGKNKELTTLTATSANLGAAIKKDEAARAPFKTKVDGYLKLQEPYNKKIADKNTELEKPAAAKKIAEEEILKAKARIDLIKLDIEEIKTTTLLRVEEKLQEANNNLGQAYANKPKGNENTNPETTAGGSATSGTGNGNIEQKACCVCFHSTDIKDNAGNQCDLTQSCEQLMRDTPSCGTKVTLPDPMKNSGEGNYTQNGIDRRANMVDAWCGDEARNGAAVSTFVEQHSCSRTGPEETCNYTEVLINKLVSRGVSKVRSNLLHLGCSTYNNESEAMAAVTDLQSKISSMSYDDAGNEVVDIEVNLWGNQAINFTDNTFDMMACSTLKKFKVCAESINVSYGDCRDLENTTCMIAEGDRSSITCKNTSGGNTVLTCVDGFWQS